MDDVERVFRQLVDVIADEHPDQLHSPIQASEIYQTLLPYRRFRSALRFDTNQDYEMALLLLLAGTHGYVTIEPPQAQDELKIEADSANPNPGAIRDYAAAKVFLNANMVRQMLEKREAFAPPEMDDPAPTFPSLEEPEIESFAVGRYELDAEPVDDISESLKNIEEDRVAEIDEEYAFPDDDDPIVATCVGCSKTLPSHREVIFCPHCGSNQTSLICRACGEEMEPAWAFCITCGAKPEY